MAILFPDLSPIAFEAGPIVIRWYGLAYLAGILLGWRYALYLIKLPVHAKAVTRIQIDDFIIWVFLGIFLGGRLGYILFYNFPAYAHDPVAVFKVWQGGMSFHGGAMGVICAIFAFCWKYKIPTLRFADVVCAVVPIGLFFGRLANFVNQELYGRITAVPWGMIFPQAGPEPRHPSQLYEAGLEGLVLFIILSVLFHVRSVREKPGIISATFLMGYGLARFCIEFVREPDVQIGFLAAHLTMGQWLCVPMMLAASLLYFIALRRRAAF